MFQYSYTVSAYTATLTSSSSVSSSQTDFTVDANTVTTYEELLLTTGTYQHTYTETSASTYTISDGWAASTSSCDYSVAVSSQSASNSADGGGSTTSTYGTTEHSTNGTHSITTRSVVVYSVVDLQLSTTQACGFTYSVVSLTSGSTDYSSFTSYTFRTTTHDVFGTHTVSYRTLEVNLLVDSSGATTGNCDYLAASTQTATFVSDYTSYTAIYYYTTTHDIYNMGIHTVDGRTSEISSSIATITLSSTKVSETTSTIETPVYGFLRTTLSSQTSRTIHHLLTQFSVSYAAPENSETAYRSSGYTEFTCITISDEAPDYIWGSYYLTGSDGSTSVGYSKGVIGNTYTMASTWYYSEDFLETTSNESGISKTTRSTTYSSSSQALSYSNFGSATQAIVSLGDKAYITTVVVNSSQTSYSSSLLSVSSHFTSLTKVTSFTFPLYLTINSSISGPAAANRTTSVGTKTTSMMVGTTNTAGDATTTTSSFSNTIVSTRTTTSTQHTYTTVSFSVTDTKRRYLYAKYLALNGEVLYIPTLTDTGSSRLADAGFTVTSWAAEPASAAYATAYAFEDSRSTISSGGTFADYTYNSRYVTGVPALAMTPNNISVYRSIPTPMSAMDYMMLNENNDYALFGLQAYNRVDSTSEQEVAYGAGAFDQTVNEVAGAISFSEVTSTSTPIQAARIHPRATVAIDTSSALGAEYLFNYSTSNIVTRV